MKKILLVFSFFVFSCTSDEVLRSEKTSFYNIYKDLVIRNTSSNSTAVETEKAVYDRKWLSKFNQPIILLSSLDGKRTATLVALGNYKNKLTWVSADGISVSFSNGILIATRGYSQDLMESQHNNLDSIFRNTNGSHLKTYRYLNAENDYQELNFSCSIKAQPNINFSTLELNLQTIKFTENCRSKTTRHVNEYYVLPKTNIVLKSKQWISEANGSIIINNFYAFQNNLF